MSPCPIQALPLTSKYYPTWDLVSLSLNIDNNILTSQEYWRGYKDTYNHACNIMIIHKVLAIILLKKLYRWVSLSSHLNAVSTWMTFV